MANRDSLVTGTSGLKRFVIIIIIFSIASDKIVKNNIFTYLKNTKTHIQPCKISKIFPRLRI